MTNELPPGIPPSTPSSNQPVMMGIPPYQQQNQPQKSKGSSSSSIIALVLGILSLTCCGFFAGIPAFFIGRSEIKSIDEGRSDEANRVIAKIGMILGLVGAAFSCIGTLAYLTLIALGIGGGMMHDKFPF